MPSFPRFFLSLLTLLTVVSPAVAQLEKFLPALKGDFSREEVVISADTFGVDQKTGWVDAKGNVKVKASDHELTADKVRLHREKGDIQASGNVKIRRSGFGTWTGEYIEYNYKTGKGLTSAGDVVAKDFRIHAEEVERREDGRFDLNGLAMTTCTNEPGRWHWCVRGSGRYRDNDYVEVFNAVPYLFGVPFAYLPWAYRDLDTHYGLRLMPGYTSRWGGYLMTGYLWNVFRTKGGYALDASTHVDYRYRRGFGYGQNFHWNLQEWGRGHFEAYYADDQNPRSSWRDRNWISDYVEDRYRFRLFHKADVSPRDQLIFRGTYVSDSVMRHDFFEHEDRGESIPMNFASYEHRENTFASGINASGPLNDFYPGVAHLPEAWLNIVPQPLLAGLNYESQSRAGYLERHYSEYEKAEDIYKYYPGKWAEYNTVRLETAHRLTYPFKLWDALSVVPRAGYRGTYYADNQRYEDIYRQSGELGVELSMRGTSEWSGGWRHTVEPYLDYSYQPTDISGTRGTELYYFDRFDRTLGWFDQFGQDGVWLPYDWHGVRPGVRNFFQTKGEDGKVRTFLDFDAYGVVQFDSDGPKGEDGVRDVGAKAVVSPTKDVDVKAQVEWDTEDDLIAYANLSAFYKVNESFRFGGGYLGRDHDLTDYGYSPVAQWNRVKENLVYAGYTHALNDQWSYSPYIRFDARENDLDEVGGYIRFQLDCLVFQLRFAYVNEYMRIDGSERGDDFRVSFTMWLRAQKKGDTDEWRAW